jgi:capsid protein
MTTVASRIAGFARKLTHPAPVIAQRINESFTMDQPPAAAIATAGPTQIVRVGANRQMDVKARFDSQFTTPLNAAHFALMDAMSIDAAASWMVRRKLRMMCRYEFHNNPLLMGLIDTYADYVIGTGPRLHITTKDKALNKAVENLWINWEEEVGFSEKLHGSCCATCYNGEGFTLLRNNPGLENPIKLDVFDVEADQVTSPLFGMYPAEYPDQYFDGVVLDPWGKPRIYHVLRQHPGAFGAFVILGYVFDPWPASNVMHDYRRIRPGQQRGLPSILPALPNAANLRRLGLATVLSAENAAKWGISVETPAIATAAEPLTDANGQVIRDQNGAPVFASDMMEDTWEMEYGAFNRLPAGTKASMLKTEQPGANYDTLVNIELGALGRALGMPLFIVSLDARQANMSSAYVAMQPYGKRIRAERKRYNRLLNTRVWPQFIREAALLGLIPASAKMPDDPVQLPHAWTWDRVNDHADPSKVASASQTRIDTGVTSRRQEAADLSLDIDEQDEMSAADYGVTLDEYRAAIFEGMLARRGNGATAGGEAEEPPETPGSPAKEGTKSAKTNADDEEID